MTELWERECSKKLRVTPRSSSSSQIAYILPCSLFHRFSRARTSGYQSPTNLNQTNFYICIIREHQNRLPKPLASYFFLLLLFRPQRAGERNKSWVTYPIDLSATFWRTSVRRVVVVDGYILIQITHHGRNSTPRSRSLAQCLRLCPKP